jgi:hypothetical protein
VVKLNKLNQNKILYIIMTLITRQFGPNAKGKKLSIAEMDGNFLFLDSKSVSSEILINTSADESVGKQYKTFAGAFAYIATQNPSASNTWSVRFSGKITENITIPEYVTVIGNDKSSSIIDGKVSFASGGTGGTDTTTSNNVINCTIKELIGTSTFIPIICTESLVTPYIPCMVIYEFNTQPTTGTYRLQFTITGGGGILTSDIINWNASLTEIRDAIRSISSPLYNFDKVEVSLGETSVQYVILCYGLSADLIITPSYVYGPGFDTTISTKGSSTGEAKIEKLSFNEQGNGEWEIKLDTGSYATGLIMLQGAPNINETMTIDNVTYEFTLGGSYDPNNVVIDMTQFGPDPFADVISIINAHQTNTIAYQYQNGGVFVQANTFGSIGNSIVISSTITDILLSGSTLSGGSDSTGTYTSSIISGNVSADDITNAINNLYESTGLSLGTVDTT